ncbi:hypothetical protein IF2G_11142 [Cordyceps javanica]|nr:hypothetical protein IF2G_11142 [Cordyceps javanica]
MTNSENGKERGRDRGHGGMLGELYCAHVCARQALPYPTKRIQQNYIYVYKDLLYNRYSK